MSQSDSPPRAQEVAAGGLPRERLLDIDPIAVFESVKAFVGFGPADSQLLRSLSPHVEPRLDEIVGDFYERIFRDPRAMSAITGGEEQVGRLKESLKSWIRLLLEGPHDETFAFLQARIGRVHVRVGLDQAYMISGVQVFREHLVRILCGFLPTGDERCMAILAALEKVLTIVLSLMLETYREDFVRKIIETEKSATMRRLAALGEVAASMAHEIRNPLAGISGAIQVLARELDVRDPRQEILREVHLEIARLDERVNDLLVYSRPSAPTREPTRPAEVLETTRRLLAGDPASRGVRLHIDAPEELEALSLDRGQIQQVLVNLVLNAMQALDGEGEVWLGASAGRGGALIFEVEDSGPGIRPEDLERIFQPFYTTRMRGTGLGLSISRRLIEAHGGSLEASRGRRGRGARFTITLPRTEDTPSSSEPGGGA